LKGFLPIFLAGISLRIRVLENVPGNWLLILKAAAPLGAVAVWADVAPVTVVFAV
jgi:hypothetical protein